MVDSLKMVTKANESFNVLKGRMSTKQFPKAFALKVPTIQFLEKVDHAEDKKDLRDIILHANASILSVAISAAKKDLDFAISESKSVKAIYSQRVFEYVFKRSDPLFRVFLPVPD